MYRNAQESDLDLRTQQAPIRLAIEGRQPDGWYDLGAIDIESSRVRFFCFIPIGIFCFLLHSLGARPAHLTIPL